MMKPVHVIGVPLDLGGNRRGVDMGPSALRIAGLDGELIALGRTVVDCGDLLAPIRETQDAPDPTKRYVRDIAAVCRQLYERSRTSLAAGALPLVLGGDH